MTSDKIRNWHYSKAVSSLKASQEIIQKFVLGQDGLPGGPGRPGKPGWPGGPEISVLIQLKQMSPLSPRENHNEKTLLIYLV